MALFDGTPSGLTGFQTFSLAGTAVQDLFSGFGSLQSAGAYKTAAAAARLNAQFTKESTAVQEYQAQRKAFQVIGGQKADIAAAGLAESGTALDLLRDSTQQAALTKEMIGQQGLITEASYNAQAAAYQQQAAAATTSGIGQIAAGVVAAAAVFAL